MLFNCNKTFKVQSGDWAQGHMISNNGSCNQLMLSMQIWLLKQTNVEQGAPLNTCLTFHNKHKKGNNRRWARGEQ